MDKSDHLDIYHLYAGLHLFCRLQELSFWAKSASLPSGKEVNENIMKRNENVDY